MLYNRISLVCIKSVFVPKVKPGEPADVTKVEHGVQRVNCFWPE